MTAVTCRSLPSTRSKAVRSRLRRSTSLCRRPRRLLRPPNPPGPPDGLMIRSPAARRALALGGLILVALLLVACSSRRAVAYQYDWNIFFDSLFRPDPRILRGIALTITVAIA